MRNSTLSLALALLGAACSGTGVHLDLSGIASDDERVVVVGSTAPFSEGTLIIDGGEPAVLSSVDGDEWASSSLPSNPGLALFNVVRGAEQFVAVGGGIILGDGAAATTRQSLVLRSADGVSWEPTLDNLGGPLRTIAFGNGQFLAASFFDGTLFRSDDGLTFTEVEVPGFVPQETVVFERGVFVVGGRNEDNVAALASSADAEAWQVQTFSDFQSATPVGAAGDQLFATLAFDCCFGEDPNGFREGSAVSTDGETWALTEATMPAGPIARGDSGFVSVSGFNVSTSTNGAEWSARQLSGPALNDVAFFNGRFLSVGRNLIRSSTDGGVWETAHAHEPGSGQPQ